MGFDKHKWFEKWFNTPYYHLLYDNRNFKEADAFIFTLVNHLNLKKDSKIWDLACGKGRHAIALNKYDLDVIGTDLSEESIKEALNQENEKLQFYTLDMRSPFRSNYFDYILNLFTSFGYFSNANDDLKVFKSVSNSLKKNGLFVFDYLNKNVVISTLQQTQEIVKSNVKFTISKHVEGNTIIKKIKIEEKGISHEFQESVKLYSVDDIMLLAQKAGLEKVAIFGDYNLNEFIAKTSNRMIFIFRKK